MDYAGIPPLSMSSLISSYNLPTFSFIPFIIVGGLLVHLLFDVPNVLDPFLSCFFLGTLSSDNIDEDQWVLISRVSSKSQLSNTSTGTQLEHLNKEVERMGGEIVKEFERAESAATMDRESADEILQMARDGRFQILGIWKLDRLTRADPWESIEYMSQLKDAGIILYSSGHGYFDWDELYDVRRIYNQVVFSREWYVRIKENAEEGQISNLEQGKWPFGDPHFGYVTDRNKNIVLTDLGRKIIPKIFQSYLETENRAKTRREINDSDELQEKTLSDNQIKTILESQLCIGHLCLKGEMVHEDRGLKVIDKETYHEAQRILRTRQSTETVEDISAPVNQIARQFGVRFALSELETVGPQCPNCNAALNQNGSVTRFGQKNKNYRCSQCDWQGPLVGEDVIREIHGVHLLKCPFCYSVEKFAATKLPGDTEYTCKFAYFCLQCGNRFDSQQPPDKYHRAFNDPDLAFDLDEDRAVGDAPIDSVKKEEMEPANSDELSGNAEGNQKTSVENNGGRPRKLDLDKLPELEKCLMDGPEANGLESGPWTRGQIVTLIETKFDVSVSKVTATRYVRDLDWVPPWE